MSGSSVTVLTPNGRRQTVKCTPNTTVLQIIEEVCKKHELDPNEYDVKHHNKVLDTTATFRFSGLPNNAQLELKEAVKKRAESEITLAVSLEDGSRLMGNFNPHETLLNVLVKLCPESITPEQSPVVIYTRREIYGESLKTTTLKHLGLTGGRAMIRLIHKTPEELKIQANVSAPLPSKPVEEKPYHRKLIKSPSPPPQNETASTSKAPESPKAAHKSNTVDLVKLAREKRKSQEKTTDHQEKRKINTEIKPTAAGSSKQEPMEVDACPKKSQEENIEDEFVFLGSRNAILFSLETAQAVPSEDLPEDFFELTLDDAKRILRDVRRARRDMENMPMLTSNLRNLEESKKQLRQLNKYKKSIIRIQFPDRNVLQGTFLPTDTIEDVHEFVREFLDNKRLDFYIYTTPPKCILNKENRLIDVNCVPGALVHFGTDEKCENYLKCELQNKFTSSSMATMVTSRIRLAATRPSGGHFLEESDSDLALNGGESGPSTQPTEEYTGRKVEQPEKLPKWFKPSK